MYLHLDSDNIPVKQIDTEKTIQTKHISKTDISRDLFIKIF